MSELAKQVFKSYDAEGKYLGYIRTWSIEDLKINMTTPLQEMDLSDIYNWVLLTHLKTHHVTRKSLLYLTIKHVVFVKKDGVIYIHRKRNNELILKLMEGNK